MSNEPLRRDTDDPEFQAQLQALLDEVDRIVAASRRGKNAKVLCLPKRKPIDEWSEDED